MINKKDKKDLKIILIVLLLMIFITAFPTVLSEEGLQTTAQPTELQTTITPTTPEYYYYPSLNDPSNFMSWNNDFCNQTESMDFIVELSPEACQPSPVTSDLLEEQNVPVLCKLTGIKINPFIEVPYIKSVRPIVENQSPQIAYVNFYPARSALGYYQFSDSSMKVSQGTPTLSNLGYLVVSLKQQPIESKMPKNVTAKIAVNITYDIAKTYGINTQQFVLPVLSQQEWLDKYKKFSFWQNRGYIRLQEVKGQNAKISVYSNANNQPIITKELREGDSFSVRLPGFYCQEEVKVSLDEIDTPGLKARLVVNGDDYIIGEGGEVADSGCFLDRITSDKYSYGGEVSVSCMGSVGAGATGSSILKLQSINSNLKITDAKNPQGYEKEFTVGDEIETFVFSNGENKKEYYYVAHIGKLAKTGRTVKTTEFANVVILFSTETRAQLGVEEKNKVIQAFQDFLKGNNAPAVGSSYDLKASISKDSRVKENIVPLIIEKGVAKEPLPANGVKFEVVSVEGAKQTYYSTTVEQAYQQAITQYRAITAQYTNQENPSGGYYGVRALRAAADLAAYMFKEQDQINFLQELVDKYQESSDEYVQAEVEDAKLKIFSLSYGSGDKSTVKNTDKGTYYITLLSVDKPGFNSKQATLKVDNSQGNYIIEDKIKGDTTSDWTITQIDDDKVVFSWSNSAEITITKGSYQFLNSTRVDVVSTYIKREAKVTVWPFEKERTTSTNFSVVIGIEKRAIQLTPKQIQDRILTLNKTIETVSKYVNLLEKTTVAWKNICYGGGTVLWLKNLVQGVSGESFARKYVMKAWSEKCASEEYRSQLGNGNIISVSQCYKKNSSALNQDVKTVSALATEANEFIKKIKAKEGVVTSSGLLGLSKQIDDDKFLEEAQNLFLSEGNAQTLIQDSDVEILLIKLSTQQKQRLLENPDIKNSIGKYGVPVCAGQTLSTLLSIPPIDLSQNKTLKACVVKVPINVSNAINNLNIVAAKGQIFSDDIKELYLILAINHKSEGISLVLRDYNNMKMFAKFDNLNNLAKQVIDEDFYGQLGLDIASFTEEKQSSLKVSTVETLSPEIMAKKFSPDKDIQEILGKYVNYKFKVFRTSSETYFSILEPASGGMYQHRRVFKVQMIKEGKDVIITFLRYEKDDKEHKTGELMELSSDERDKLPKIILEDISKCAHEIAKEDFKITFWDKGAYEGMIAYMPLQRNEGWYFATKAYTGLEGKLVAWKETGAINEYWICNVGSNGKPEFNHYKGPEGDDDCCFQISKTTGMQIPTEIKALADKAEACIPKAIDSYNKKENPVNAGACGKPSLGKSPVLIPSTQCEDFMSPEDCSLLFNLCDPVICPSSRCDFGGRLPVENVIQSGIIGSLLLCSGNKEVIMPICVSGLYNGLDSLNNMILIQYRDCLQKQLATGQTTGICDTFHSFYTCQLLWGNIDPFIKAGIPLVTEAVANQGGGEYSLFSDAIKNAEDSFGYFTKNYGSNTFNLFKQRATAQNGTTFCDRYFSIVYPTATEFLSDLTKADSYYQLFASVDEISQGSNPESQYRVIYSIYAGKDTPVSYYVYLKKKTSQQYEYQLEKLSVKNAVGFLAVGQSVSEKRDFTAPPGYSEICVNVNGKEFCGFASVSTSFAVQEVQNLYLQDQIKKNIKTEQECKAGSATLMPTPSLSLQSQIQEHLTPEIYRRGIIRICASEDPGSTAEPNRYERIGYCDDEKVGCWLDMNSVNSSISDLGIREDIINYSEEKTINYLLETNVIDPVAKTETAIFDLDKKLQDIKIELYGPSKNPENKEGIFGDFNKKIEENIGNPAQLSLISKEIKEHAIISRLDELAKSVSPYVDKALNIKDKANLEWIKAQALEDKVKFISLTDAMISAKATGCENHNAKWISGATCPDGYELFTDASDKKDHPDDVCCIAVTKISTGYSQACVAEVEKLMQAADYLKDKSDQWGSGGDKNCGTYAWNVYKVAKEKFGLNGPEWPSWGPQNIGSSRNQPIMTKDSFNQNNLKPGDLILYSENGCDHINFVGTPAEQGKFYVIGYDRPRQNPIENNLRYPDYFSRECLGGSGTVNGVSWQQGLTNVYRLIPACVSGGTSIVKPGTCGDYHVSTSCNEKSGCWWDTPANACRACPSKCEGEHRGIFGIEGPFAWFDPTSVRDNVFTTKEDCITNGCSLTCLWLETDKKCITTNTLTPTQLQQQFQQQLSNINSMTEDQLNALRNSIQTSSLDANFKNQAIAQIDKRLAELQSGTTTPPSGTYSISLASSVNNGAFLGAGLMQRLVNYNDNVKVCLIIKSNGVDYSGVSINSLVKSWTFGKPMINWISIVPQPLGDYNGVKMLDSGQKIKYSEATLNQNDWCVDVSSKEGSYWYRADVTINNNQYSSTGKIDSQGYMTDGYDQGIESDKVLRISRKSSNSNSIISMMESFKNVPFVGQTFSSTINGKEYQMTELYKGMECFSLISASARQVFGKQYEYKIEDIIAKNSNIIEDSTGENIEKVPVKNFPGLGIPYKTGQVIFLFNTGAGEYDHSMIITGDTGTQQGYIDGGDSVIYTSSDCVVDGTVQQRGVSVRKDGNICYTKLSRFFELNSPATLVELKTNF